MKMLKCLGIYIKSCYKLSFILYHLTQNLPYIIPNNRKFCNNEKLIKLFIFYDTSHGNNGFCRHPQEMVEEIEDKKNLFNVRIKVLDEVCHELGFWAGNLPQKYYKIYVGGHSKIMCRYFKDFLALIENFSFFFEENS